LFHAGGITGLDVSPAGHIAVTSGADGSVRAWDFARGALLHTSRFGAAASACAWASTAVDPTGRTIGVGFADGTIRVLECCADGLRLVSALKTHAARVRHLLFSPDGRLLATGADDDTVFFVSVRKSGCAPLGFVQLAGAPSAMCWADDSARLVVACEDELLRITPPGENVDNQVSSAPPPFL